MPWGSWINELPTELFTVARIADCEVILK